MLSPVNIDDIHNLLSIRHSKWDTGLGVTQAAAESGVRGDLAVPQSTGLFSAMSNTGTAAPTMAARRQSGG